MSRRKNEKYLGFGVSTGGSQGRRAAAQAGQAEGSLTSEQEDQMERDRWVVSSVAEGSLTGKQEDQMERDRWVVSSVSDPYSLNPDPDPEDP